MGQVGSRLGLQVGGSIRLGSRVEGGIPGWTLGGTGGIPPRIPGEEGSHLGSRVGGGIPPWIPGGRWDHRLDPRWERPDPANGGGIQAIPPGIPGGIGGIPPESHLPFYLRSKLGV